MIKISNVEFLILIGFIFVAAFVMGRSTDQYIIKKLKESFLFPIEEIKLAMICAASGDRESLRAEIYSMEQMIKSAGSQEFNSAHSFGNSLNIMKNTLKGIANFHLNLAKESLEKDNYYAALCALAKSNRDILQQQIVKKL